MYTTYPAGRIIIIPVWKQAFTVVTIPPVSDGLYRPTCDFTPVAKVMLDRTESNGIVSPLRVTLVDKPLPSAVLLADGTVKVVGAVAGGDIVAEATERQQPGVVFYGHGGANRITVAAMPTRTGPEVGN